MDLSSAILLSWVIAKPIKKPRRHGVVRVRQGWYCTAIERYNLHCYSVIGGGISPSVSACYVVRSAYFVSVIPSVGASLVGAPNDVAKIHIFFELCGFLLASFYHPYSHPALSQSLSYRCINCSRSAVPLSAIPQFNLYVFICSTQRPALVLPSRTKTTIFCIAAKSRSTGL